MFVKLTKEAERELVAMLAKEIYYEGWPFFADPVYKRALINVITITFGEDVCKSVEDLAKSLVKPPVEGERIDCSIDFHVLYDEKVGK